MHTKNFKFGLAVFAAVLLTLGLSISLQSLLAAWIAPTSAPPNNNIAAPINVSAIAQSKIGSLGIGVTSPDQKFVVQDDTAAVARIRITDTGQNPELQLQYGSDTNNDHWAIYNEQANDSLRIWGGGASGDNRLTILQNGNVGIGTTNPSQKLDVGSNNISANDYWIQAANDGAGQWASQVGGSIAWPEGHYCIIQAHDQSCPAGFTATNPTATGGHTNFDSGRGPIYGGSSSYWETTKIERADDSSGKFSILKWAWCCK